MVRTQTNNATFAVTREATQNNLPTTPIWRRLEVNDPSTVGATITKATRRPISRVRGRRASVTVDLDSTFEYQTDLTLDTLEQFAEGFVGNVFENVDFDLRDGTGTIPPPAVASTDSFTVDAVSTALGGKLVYALTGAKSLIYTQGYTNAANNGLFVLSADVAPTDTAVAVTANLVDETPPTNAICVVAGVQVTAADLTLTVSMGIGTLTSAADITNWATLGVKVGQHIYIGSADTDGTPIRGLGTGTDKYGRARVRAIAGAVLTLDKLDATLTADTGGGSVVDVLIGKFARNVPTDANGTTEGTYLERFYRFEVGLDNLGGVGTDSYLYPQGNASDAMSINLPLAELGGLELGFVGTDTPNPTTTRATGASTALAPLRVAGFNTSSQFASLTTDLVSSQDNLCFKSLTVSIANNVTPEKCLGTLGSVFTNFGQFFVDIEAQMLLTEGGQIAGVRDNTTFTFTTMLVNSDGGFVLDVPALKYNGGDLEFPEDASVLINLGGEAFNDPNNAVLPDVSLGMTFFVGNPYVI